MSQLDPIAEKAIALAKKWQNETNKVMSNSEKEFHLKMNRLLKNPEDKILLIKLLDQCFRPKDPSKVSDQINFLLEKHGMAGFFSDSERFLIRLYKLFGRHFPALSIPQIIGRMRAETAHVIINGDEHELNKYLSKRKADKTNLNINFLGEAILGEEEAQKRIQLYKDALANPQIEYISVKVSTLYSQISPLSFEHSLHTVTERLSELYQFGQQYEYQDHLGRIQKKFINLDMEEYKDLELTVEAFKAALSLPENLSVYAGIVIQAYLPDSLDILEDITRWSLKRIEAGGSPVKVRIVKGANLEMERIEASLHGWPLVTYSKKVDTDTNFKVLLDYALTPKNITAVKIGIGSHNLFELAYGYSVALENGVDKEIVVEMLEGMADSAKQVIQAEHGELLLYAPVAAKNDFVNGIAYLIRRLDENTGPNNYLRHAFNLKTDSENWEFIKQQFINSYINKGIPSLEPVRTQDRRDESTSLKVGTFYHDHFENEPDTDWILPANRAWAQAIKERWSNRTEITTINLVINGDDIFNSQSSQKIKDFNTEDAKHIANYCTANTEQLKEALKCAVDDEIGWSELSFEKRHKLLSNTAREFRKRRNDLIGVAAAEVGKTFSESDTEISEAIDFLEYYPWAYKQFNELENLKMTPKGVGVVISPWNFPLAIPVGGIASALITGNTVLFKPSSNAVWCGYELCKCFWEAGIPKEALQFVPSRGEDFGAQILKRPEVAFAILTGGTETATSILQKKPSLQLNAETGGKNATIVTASADRDQAIKNIIHSAFSNSGQKCSATSLLILESEVFHDQNFKNTLIDATKSLTTGGAWEFQNKTGRLISPPSGDLDVAINNKSPQEEIVLAPQRILNNFGLTPSIRWNVKEDDFCFQAELFGPILAVVEATDLKHAVELANKSVYGLTSGLETLDEREINYWKSNIEAGNLYINRSTTGAIVQRQPFGGFGKSSFGHGLKAGGPNYLLQFVNIEEVDYPSDKRMILNTENNPIQFDQYVEKELLEGCEKDIHNLDQALNSYYFNYKEEFETGKDSSNIRGEDNILLYQKIDTVLIRVHLQDSLFDILARIFACKTLGINVHLSLPTKGSKAIDALNLLKEQLLSEGDDIISENDQALIKRIHSFKRIRYAHPKRVPETVRVAAINAHIQIQDSPPLMEGRIELLNYLREQSISHRYHRYGNVGGRDFVDRLGN